MLLWIHNGLLVASPSGAELRKVAAVTAGGANPFKATPFYGRHRPGLPGRRRLAVRGRPPHPGGQGRGREDPPRSSRRPRSWACSTSTSSSSTAGRSTAGPRPAPPSPSTRRGAGWPRWLAAPAPMGSLSFFSPDANFVSAFVVKSPVSILDEMLSIKPELAQELADAQAKHGFDLRNDLVAPLGGEVAMGVDGPLLPTPSWKLVAEVYDTARLQQTFQKAVTQLDAELRANGKPGVQLTSQQAGGRTYYSIGSADGKLSISYLFEDGYLIAGPSRALLEQAHPAPGFRGDARHHGQVPRPAGSGRPGERLGAGLHQHRADRAVGLRRCCRTARPTGGKAAGRPGRSSARCSPGRDRRSTTPTRSRTASSSPAATRTPWV